MAERTLNFPGTTPENAPFFDAANAGKLLLGKCGSCRDFHYYPRMQCPHCGSKLVDWLPAVGTGVIYSWSTLRRGTPVPYTLAYVTLDEGVSVLTNMVDCDARDIRIGVRVQVCFKPTDGGVAVPMFTVVNPNKRMEADR
jgi:uncharacterized OB-fold protein